ncbi:hypothetical protein DKY63_17675 [Pseudomonas putida]|uniref:RHS repeat-associated core domain-containing protein n=1 Tax=Pseudomonas putida TaxID=303 RepID=A0A2Z4RMW8_PSEPU|nr:RHS repeat-associated core domain-containing protein [Pseudomonas putida]AWY41618.1 hypothetical protein DKY63_17675 [Pseudomonas putida]
MPASHQTKYSVSTDPGELQTLLLATDLQQNILAQLHRNAPNHFAYTVHGLRGAPLEMDTHLGFNGQLQERSFGWYYLGNGHRIYNPVLMRFHGPDRLSPFDKGGVNAYAYCGGDPVNREDPSGRFFSAIGSLIGALEAVAGHTENIATALFRSRPRGVLGYATVVSNVGYAGMTTGTAMRVAGHAAGEAVFNVGAALVSAGNGIRAVHGVAKTLKNTRLGRTIIQRNAIGRSATQELGEVIVSAPKNSEIRIQMPQSSSLPTDSHNIRTS